MPYFQNQYMTFYEEEEKNLILIHKSCLKYMLVGKIPMRAENGSIKLALWQLQPKHGILLILKMESAKLKLLSQLDGYLTYWLPMVLMLRAKIQVKGIIEWKCGVLLALCPQAAIHKIKILPKAFQVKSILSHNITNMSWAAKDQW